MAKYRVKNSARNASGLNPLPTPGFVFEWDGVDLDDEGDIRIPNSSYEGSTGWVLPEFVELLVPAGRVAKGTRTVKEEVYTLTLSRVEALRLRDLLDATCGWDDLNDLFNDLEEAL